MDCTIHYAKLCSLLHTLSLLPDADWANPGHWSGAGLKVLQLSPLVGLGGGVQIPPGQCQFKLSALQVDSELVTEKICRSQAAGQHAIDQQGLVSRADAAEKKAGLHAQQVAQLQADFQVDSCRAYQACAYLFCSVCTPMREPAL